VLGVLPEPPALLLSEPPPPEPPLAPTVNPPPPPPPAEVIVLKPEPDIELFEPDALVNGLLLAGGAEPPSPTVTVIVVPTSTV